ncbi:hypothetical protein BSPWISOXPB_1182 [uncultured Gammaproteobacteria bacterium]|nr:hypothetical protein BSPWISOXPB_1182 [uncultured Gammaproteobacteria bacterium]
MKMDIRWSMERFMNVWKQKKCQKLIDLIPEIDKRNIWYASVFIASAM